MEKVLYPHHPVRVIITGPSNSGKSVFLTNLILNIDEYNKEYIYSPSLHQYLYQKISKFLSNYIHIHIIPNILNEENMDMVIDEIVNDKHFVKSDTEIKTHYNFEELRFPLECDDGVIIFLDDLNEKK